MRGAAHDDIVCAAEADAAPRPPSIPGFEIEALVGSGGCGSVWRAREVGVLQRTVAIKTLRADAIGTRLEARFHAERQLLAMLDHPSIVPVYEAGSDSDGRPWFAMPYIDGSPLTVAASERGLSVRARVELIDRVAAAVEHAHQRGIIHRDLKPTNVLVPGIPGDPPLPRIIDFGVAKASVPGHEAVTGQAHLGQRLGTPGYMSPEQSSGQPVDTRTDIWALGVMMHELLTGTRPQAAPCDSADVWTGSAADTPGVIAPSASAGRDPAIGPPDGDLDAVVARCLRPAPQDRYASVSHLRDDLARWLRGEPVSARTDAPLHEIWLFIRRYRAASLVAACGIAAAGILLAVALSAARDARAQASRAEALLARARISESFTNEFLLGSSGLAAVRRDDRLVRRTLETLAADPAPDPAAEPLLAAAKLAFLGRGYGALGDWGSSTRCLADSYALFNAHLPHGSDPTVDVLIELLRPRNVTYDPVLVDDAERHLRAMRPRDPSGDRADTLEWRIMLARAANAKGTAAGDDLLRAVRQRVAQLRASAPDSQAALQAAAESIIRCAWSDRPELAMEDLGAILEDLDRGRIGPPTRGLLLALGAGAYAASLTGQYELPARVLERFGDDFVRIFGTAHRATFDIFNNGGFCLAAIGRERESIAVLERLLPWAVEAYGDASDQARLVRGNIEYAHQQLAARGQQE